MANPRDSLISALANGSPIDWGTLEHPSWGGSDAGLRARDDAPPRGRSVAHSLVRSASAGAWALVISLAVVQVAVAVTGWRLSLVQSGPSSPSWVLSLIALVFGLSGSILVLGGRQDRRVQSLGALFAMIGAAFAHPLLGRTGGASADLALRLLHSAPADAFLAVALWGFVWTFPSVPRTRSARGIGIAFLVLSSGLGALLLAANIPEAWQVSMSSSAVSVPGALNRDGSRSLYWLLLFAAAVPAFPYLVWKSRQDPQYERQRVRFFLIALVVGISPMVLAVLASIFIPSLGAPPWRYVIGSMLWAALASVVPTTAYAVLVDRVMEIHLAVDRAKQWAFARYLVWIAGLGPIGYLALDLYAHRHVTLTDYFDQGGPFSLFVLMFVGFTALTFRYQMLRGVDGWFRQERADYAESLSRLEQSLRATRTLRDVAGALAHQVERAVRPSTVAVLVVNEQSGEFVPLAGSVPSIAADSVLAELARSASIEIRVTLGINSKVAGLLPPADQTWLTEGGIHLVTPLVGSSGGLLGLVALGRSQDGLHYTEHDYAVVASMCGHTALQLENQWLRERPSQDGFTTPSRERFSFVNWQNEPAECCSRCSRIWPTGTEVCPCGGPVAPAALPLLVKGKFRLESLLGQGGMGVVYLATDITLGRKVALKTLPRVSDALATRLQQEAVAMATVRHPHLALIYGAEQWRDTPVLIVEYLEGGTLLDWLRRGPLTVSETLSLGIVLSDVLDRLHRTSILHRDVKPSNIGYTMDGVPKLLDLGLAAMFDGTGAEQAGPGAVNPQTELAILELTRRSTVTSNSGQLLGTLRYMSPEALAGESPRPSFDLWSLSFVLYEALAGRHPFADLSADDVAARIRESAIPDIRDFSPDCPATIAGFFRDSLSPVPSRRPATAAALRGVLQTLQT